jgi:hypothetical protein
LVVQFRFLPVGFLPHWAPIRERFWQALDLKLQCTHNCCLMTIVFALHPLHYFYQFGMSKDETKSTPNMENRSLNLGVWDGYNVMAFFFILAFLWRCSKSNWLKQGYNQDKASPLFDYLVFNKVSSNWILFCVFVQSHEIKWVFYNQESSRWWLKSTRSCC